MSKFQAVSVVMKRVFVDSSLSDESLEKMSDAIMKVSKEWPEVIISCNARPVDERSIQIEVEFRSDSWNDAEKVVSSLIDTAAREWGGRLVKEDDERHSNPNNSKDLVEQGTELAYA